MKRLYKSRKEKVIDGVCGGVAEYFDTDPVLVRILFVLFTFVGGSGIIAYIVGMIIMPTRPAGAEEDEKAEKKTAAKAQAKPEKIVEQPVKTSTSGSGALVIGIILIALGGIFLIDNFPILEFHPFYWLRRHFWEYFIPGILIITGLILLVKSKEKK